MEKISDVHHYNQETTRKGSMKIEVVVEEAKKPKRDRPGSASSIRNIEDIQKRQKVPMIMFQYLFYLSSTYTVKLLFTKIINLQTAITVVANKEGHSIMEVERRENGNIDTSLLRLQRREENRRSLFRWRRSRRNRKKLKRSEQRRLRLLRPRRTPVIIDSGPGPGHAIFLLIIE